MSSALKKIPGTRKSRADTVARWLKEGNLIRPKRSLTTKISRASRKTWLMRHDTFKPRRPRFGIGSSKQALKKKGDK